MKRYILYYIENSPGKRFRLSESFKVEIFNPTFKQWTNHKLSGIKELIVYLLWLILSRAKYKIIYVKEGQQIAHRTVLLPKIFKFPFMKENDWEIGPCYTSPKFRGKGIYPAVLQWIVEHFNSPQTAFYIMAEENNIPSQKGIEKAGFKRKGICEKTSFGIYKLI